MRVVLVESPAKAKTIGKYLGSDFNVLASYGHVSDLPAKDGSVRPDNDFEMIYETVDRSRKHLEAIAGALGGADGLVLATDPDREGEAISWHVLNWLRDKGALGGRTVERVVFHEVTRDAVRKAMAEPRDVDMDLVNAQQARRALDYLVGFTLSPVLWRKLPGSRSAGRVQSVALRLICEREAEIEAFVSQEYWTVDADFTARGGRFTAQLSHLGGTRLGKFDLKNATMASEAVACVRSGRDVRGVEGGAAAARDDDAVYRVESVESKKTRRRPAPPFTTSTLQQEASRKLGLKVQRTMSLAQKLYEGVDIGGETVGLITYMRTDSVALSRTALADARRHVETTFGADYLPEKPRVFRVSARNAQEAHEAIRPTDFDRTPRAMAGHLDATSARLYELIWNRALASQMAEAVFNQTRIVIVSRHDDVALKANGSVMVFDGFIRLYREGRDDQDEQDRGERRLPEVREGERLALGEVRPEQHHTEPPPRLTEASLVKRLEELGIGRPSTYASIIGVLQDRDYVELRKKAFVPRDRGRLVTAFLEAFFRRYVEYDFTASLERDLDRVSNGDIDWKQVLRDFWTVFHAVTEDAGKLERSQILAEIETILETHVFPGEGDADPRACPSCADGRLGLKLGRHGAFVGCSNYPECRFTRPFMAGDDDRAAGIEGPRHLGNDPESGLAVSLRRGPYGCYIQKGDGDDGEKPPRVSLPPGVTSDGLTLEAALGLLALPREVGNHPESGETIVAGIGRFGPYLRHGRSYVSIPKGDDVLAIGLNRAVTLIAEKAASGKGGGMRVLSTLGEHPEDGQPVEIREGRYGPCIAHKRTYASLPKGTTPDSMTLASALELLASKKNRKKTPTRARTSRKPAAKRRGARATAPRRAGERVNAGVADARGSQTGPSA